ncbi:MAG: hypothetical protein ABW123_25505 [Cystobacter sp.]
MKPEPRMDVERGPARKPGRWRAPACVLPLVALMLTSGCLGPHYEVTRGEMERLVQLPPEERARNIYGVQRFVTSDDPEPAPPWEPPLGEPPPGYVTTVHGHWAPSFYVESYGGPYYTPPATRHP